jgi:shikimate dehydrogenase
MAEDLEDPRIRIATDIAQVEAETEPWDLVVNATSLGLSEADPLPVKLERLSGVGAVLDLVYRPLETRLVRRAREMGLPAEDGGELLVQQGAASFERWWGRGAPIEAMREALGRARHQVGKPG